MPPKDFCANWAKHTLRTRLFYISLLWLHIGNMFNNFDITGVNLPFSDVKKATLVLILKTHRGSAIFSPNRCLFFQILLFKTDLYLSSGSIFTLLTVYLSINSILFFISLLVTYVTRLGLRLEQVMSLIHLVRQEKKQ